MNKSKFLSVAIFLLISSPYTFGDVYDIGNRKQLFIDDRFIEQRDGVELQVNSPTKHGLVLSGVNTWENGVVYGPATTVLEDRGKYRMWYIATAADPRAIDENFAPQWTTKEMGVPRLCYAESADGINWIKPNLGIYDWRGSTANNILMETAVELGAGIFIDPKAPINQRYKLLGRLHRRSKVWPHGDAPAGGGIYIYTSADGLRWALNPTRLLPFSPDTTNMAFYDDRTGKYLAYIRTWVNGRRRVGVVETDDIMRPWPYNHRSMAAAHYQFADRSETPPSDEIPDAFGPDGSDPADVDFYFPSAVKYAWADDAYLMFPSAYRHFPAPPEGRHPNDGVLEAHMAVSRDGRQFHRISRSPYIELGLRGEKDCDRIYMGVGMLRRGDQVYQYYGGFDYTHHAAIARFLEDQSAAKEDPGYKASDLPDLVALRNRGGIFLASQRLDGFVSVDAGYQGGHFTTPAIVFQGVRLILNMNASVTGEVRVELRNPDGGPVEGFSFGDCDSLYGNDVARVVTWRHGQPDLGQYSGKTMRLAFKLRTAKLYAFQFIN